MFKSILAVSEGGSDAVMSFALARRLAKIFGGGVDVLDLSTRLGHSAERAIHSRRAFDEILSSLREVTYTAETNLAPQHALTTMGRFSDVVVLGRPGDPLNVTSATVKTAVHQCARAVMIAPPNPGSGAFSSVIVAWNGSFQATRALEYAMPILVAAREITILVIGKTPEDVGAGFIARNLGRHGVCTKVRAIDPGAVSGRARGRDLVRYTRDTRADLLVMGAYGGGELSSFLGLGGATGKVFSSCPIPILTGN
jgi:nucleotide-binding universal stress UspA family protein